MTKIRRTDREIAAPEAKALLWILEKYSPRFVEAGKRYILLKDRLTKVIKIEIGHISGKARR